MQRKHFLASAAGALLPTGAQSRKPLNVVFFLTDDHGAWALNYTGCREMHTPNLNRLAESGARFTNAFAATPVCSPSRATYMTGRLPSRHGIQDFINCRPAHSEVNDCTGPQARHYLDGQPTLSGTLAAAGYKAGLAGKWHMGGDNVMQAGFSYWATIPGGGGTYRNPAFVKNGKTVNTEGMKTDRVGDFALEFLDQTAGQPFFLYMPFFAPHNPYDFQAEEYRKLYKDSKFSCFPRLPDHRWLRRTVDGRPAAPVKDHNNEASMLAYSALVSAVDHNVGRVVQHLEKLGVLDNTLIVFTADQGHNCGHHGVWGKGNGTVPFNVFEESIRVPMIWNHRGAIKPGQVFPQFVSSYDFMPSLLDYAGLKAPADPYRAGRSYANLLRHKRYEERAELYFEYSYMRAVRTKRWKYIRRAGDWPSELFDLEKDPGEERSILDTSEGREVAAQLGKKLDAFFAARGAPPIEDWRTTTKQVLTTYSR